MADNLDDIFSNLHGSIDRETLIKYLDGNLPPQEMHRIESLLVDSELYSDAVDGLQQSGSVRRLSEIDQEISSGIEKVLQKRNEKRQRKTIKELPWIYIVIIVIILLIIVSFAVVKAYL